MLFYSLILQKYWQGIRCE